MLSGSAITDSADRSIRHAHDIRERSQTVLGWNDKVKAKHQLARDSFLQWRACGSPKNGPIASQMRLTRLSFKYALRQCKRTQRRFRASQITMCLLKEPGSRFWSWVNRELSGRCPLPPSIEGFTGDNEIVNMWMMHFQSIFNDLSCESDLDALDRLYTARTEQVPLITTEDALRAISKIKSGKAPGWDHLTSDHLLHLQPEAVACLAVLFSSMMVHTTLPEGFIHSTLVPLIKDKTGMANVVSNYRAIALSTSLSKLLESILIDRIGQFLSTNDAQFGFKSALSTTHATFALKEVIHFLYESGKPSICMFFGRK